jgi:hypothetical protein
MSSFPGNLLALQNPDGGWSYRRGGSWTEPTIYALLALGASGTGSAPEIRKAAAWLALRQRADGGLTPRESVQESTWVTALALLLPPSVAPGIDRNRALDWVLAQSGRESGWVYRLRLWMLGSEDTDPAFDGWPWYPGAAAWVAPTALTILALEKVNRELKDPRIAARAREGRKYLLARHCKDGGWNHGSTRALGYDSDSYPEATGLALLALRGETGPVITQGIARAEQHLKSCNSNEAANWLRLGLRAHGRTPAPFAIPPRGTTLDLALEALATSAERGDNAFTG